MWPLYYNCIETFVICNFDRCCYNNYDNFHILVILPVYGYMENKVNEWMNSCASDSSNNLDKTSSLTCVNGCTGNTLLVSSTNTITTSHITEYNSTLM